MQEKLYKVIGGFIAAVIFALIFSLGVLALGWVLAGIKSVWMMVF